MIHDSRQSETDDVLVDISDKNIHRASDNGGDRGLD
jgi:hypothetical protein